MLIKVNEEKKMSLAIFIKVSFSDLIGPLP